MATPPPAAQAQSPPQSDDLAAIAGALSQGVWRVSPASAFARDGPAPQLPAAFLAPPPVASTDGAAPVAR
jgi:hypothetical protein